MIVKLGNIEARSGVRGHLQPTRVFGQKALYSTASAVNMFEMLEHDHGTYPASLFCVKNVAIFVNVDKRPGKDGQDRGPAWGYPGALSGTMLQPYLPCGELRADVRPTYRPWDACQDSKVGCLGVGFPYNQ